MLKIMIVDEASFIYRFTLFSEMGSIIGLKIGCRNWKSDAETGNLKLDNESELLCFFQFPVSSFSAKQQKNKV